MRAAGHVLAGTLVGCSLIVWSSSPGLAGWISQESGTTVALHNVQFLDSRNGYAVGESGTVLKTTDGGAGWADVSIPSSYPVWDLYMISSSSGWVVTGDPNNADASGSVWHTSDGGANWSQQPLTSTRARFGVSFVSALTGWASGARSGPIDFQATTNGGVSWFNQSSSNIFGWTYGIDSVSPNQVWSAGVVYFPTATGFIVHSSDGGAHWTSQISTAVPFLYGVDFVNANAGFTVGDQGAILATTNGGSTWIAQASGTASNLTEVSFSSPAQGAACGSGGTLLRTEDGGQNWVPEDSHTSVTLNGIFSLDANAAWAVGGNGTILKRESSSGLPVNPGRPPFALLRGSPNPFRSGINLAYRVPGNGRVSLTAFSPDGRRIALLVDEPRAEGIHQIRWDGTDQGGRALPAGIYFLRLITEQGDPATLRCSIVR